MDASITKVVDVALLRPQPFDERGRPVKITTEVIPNCEGRFHGPKANISSNCR